MNLVVKLVPTQTHKKQNFPSPARGLSNVSKSREIYRVRLYAWNSGLVQCH